MSKYRPRPPHTPATTLCCRLRSSRPLPSPPSPWAPPTPVAPSWWREPSHAEGYLWGPEDAGPVASSRDWDEPAGSGAQPVKETQEAERWRLSLGGGVFLAAMATAITACAAVWSSQPLGTALVIGLSSALVVFGFGLVVGAFTGRIGGGTIVGVVLTTVLIAGSAALPQDLTTTFSERVWRPTAATEVQSHYRMGTGQGTLDLGTLRLEEGDTVRTSLRVAAGEARVVVPPDALVEVDVRVGVGGYDLPGVGTGRDQGGINGGGFRVTESYTMGPVDGEEPTGTIELTVDVGAGGISVERDLDAPARDARTEPGQGEKEKAEKEEGRP